MSVVSWIVDDAQGFLDDAAETQFGAVAATVGTITTVGATLVLVLVAINMVFQYRTMDGRTAFWLGVKFVLIGIFAQNWTQFNALSASILNGIDSIAGSLIAAVGGGTPGPSGTYAEEFDSMIADFGDYLNAAGEELNWMAGAILSNLGVFLLSLLGACRLPNGRVAPDDRTPTRTCPDHDLPDTLRCHERLFCTVALGRSLVCNVSDYNCWDFFDHNRHIRLSDH